MVNQVRIVFTVAAERAGEESLFKLSGEGIVIVEDSLETVAPGAFKVKGYHCRIG